MCTESNPTDGGMESMKCYEVMERLEELSPTMYAEEWDNVGLLVGRREKEVRKIYVALDATDEVIEEAVKIQADMLLTHHPLIFSPVSRIQSDDYIGRRILRLARHDIACYAMHTNFDIMGMADAAADEIGLKKREVLNITYEDDIAKEGIGRRGKLPHIMTLGECAEHVKQCFHIDRVKVFGDMEATVEDAAVSPGSGKSVVKDAVAAHVDVLITGDIDHHTGIDANEQGLYIIDAGHYGIEKIFIAYIKEYLRRELPEMVIYTHPISAPFVIV